MTARSDAWLRRGLRWTSWLVEFAVLVGVAVALLWPAPVDRQRLPAAFFPGSDLLLSHWPSADFVKRSTSGFDVPPLWNPHYGGGRPIAADPLAAYWYPPTQLLRLLSLHDYFVAVLWGHLVLAGLGMLLLARVAFRLPRLAALCAAVAFMATPRLVAHLGAGHVTMVQAVAWLPWCALALWATVRRPARWTAPFAVCVALLVLAGHPQIAFYGGLLLAVEGVWLLGRRQRRGWSAALGSAAGVLAGGVMALLLAGAYLVPLREFTAHSTRRQEVPITDATTLWPLLKAVAGSRMPTDVPHEAMFDPGRLVLLLALAGALWRWRAGLPLLLGCVAVGAVAFGVTSPLYKLLAWALPEFDRLRGVARIWFLALVAIAVLAGFGVAALMRLGRRVWRPLGTLAGLLCLLAVGWNVLWTDRGLVNVGPYEEFVAPSELERAVAAAAGGGRSYGAQQNVRQTVAVALDMDLADGQDPLLIERYAAFMQHAGDYYFAGYVLSIPPFQVYEPKYATFQRSHPDPVLLALVGVSVVASWTPIDDPKLKEIAYIDNTHIYRNLAYYGRAGLYAPGRDGGVPTLDDLRRLAVPVAEVSRVADRAVYRFTARSEAYLVLAWPAFPGWHAELDGRPVEVELLDGALPAVRVGPGEHRLTWAYAPRSVQQGQALSLAGLILIAGWQIGYVLVRQPRLWVAPRRDRLDYRSLEP